MRRWIARLQTQWMWLFIAMLVGLAVVPVSFPFPVDLVLLAAPLLLAFVRAVPVDRRPLAVEAPVRGGWAALNSPGSKVPSHGIRAYGQAYAIDLLQPRRTGASTSIGWGVFGKPTTDYPAFGADVHAVADGSVVASSARQQDHRGRDTWPTLVFLLLQGFVRELAGWRWIFGNHVIVDHGDGTWSAYAHLRLGSVTVRPGAQVMAGQVIGEIGNTGNSSEPHLHFQLMDHRNPTAAAGVPFRWTNASWRRGDVDPSLTSPGQPTAQPGVPGNGQKFTASILDV